MKGKIIISNNDLCIFKEVCKDRFNGRYKILEKYLHGYSVELEFTDLQDVFSLGQILQQDKTISIHAKIEKQKQEK